MIAHVCLDVCDIGAIEPLLAREFPAIAMRLSSGPALPEVTIGLERWRRVSFDIQRFDADVGAAEQQGPFCLRIEGPEGEGGTLREGDLHAVLEILTRYQRLAPRSNGWSRTEPFSRVLGLHRVMHDLRKPLIRADYDHAVDAWQWVLRLNPEASAAVQLAALFHDIERLRSEAEVRLEHLAADYEVFKIAHARTGAEMTQRALAAADLPKETVQRAAELVAEHERPGADPELSLLNDADALSFFSLNSWGFLGYYGLAHTARKVDYTLGRMGAVARARLPSFRYHPTVERLIGVALAGVSGTE